MAQTFAATVGAWVEKVEGGLTAVFRESCQELVHELDALVPVDTGALRASLRASTTAMPQIVQSGGAIPAGFGDTVLVINGADIGDVVFLGYTMAYAPYVHYGSNGRPGRPWVDLVAQRWQSIVAAKAAEVKSRLGL
jgi:hypothetical protein